MSVTVRTAQDDSSRLKHAHKGTGMKNGTHSHFAGHSKPCLSSGGKDAVQNGNHITGSYLNGQGSSSFLDEDASEIVQRLTLTEKISLLSGSDFWHTAPIPRFEIPSIKLSDGPNGARGGSFLSPTPALCLPCGTALGATFDKDLLLQLGGVLADEVKSRSALVCMGPTINIQRSPANGRAFESYAEDPFLAGELATQLVNGLQGRGVAACLKHFVANDMEHDRNGVDVRCTDRALREIYLLPYQLAQRAKPWAIMTAYNSVNGTHVSENRQIIENIARKEWGFDGLFMSDWFGTYSTCESINAGLDLEMPGPTRWRNHTLVSSSVASRKIRRETIDARAENVIRLVQRVGVADPHFLYHRPEREETLRNPRSESLARRAATESICLLKNDRGILPLTSSSKRTIGLIGPNCKARCYSGGGSAALRPSYLFTPYEGIKSTAPEAFEIRYALGTWSHLLSPLLGDQVTTTVGPEETGCTLTFWNADASGEKVGNPIHTMSLHETQAKAFGTLPEGVTLPFFAELTANFVPEYDGEYEFGLTVAGRAKLYVDDLEVVNNWTTQRKGTSFFGCGTLEERQRTKVRIGQRHRLRVDFSSMPSASMSDGVFFGRGVRLGGFPTLSSDDEIAKAVRLAEEVDTPVVVVGLNSDWESEGFDRPTLSLPLRSDELILAVARTNPRTVVVLQTGAAVTMPWIEEVSAVVWAPYGGNESGRALGDILFGHEAPSGRLSMSFPKRDQDVPAHLNFRSQEGVVEYAEGVYVGYRAYEALKIEPLFAFGHGLCYTTFKETNFRVNIHDDSSAERFSGEAGFTLTNTGDVTSSRSSLLFFSPPASSGMSLAHPKAALKGFELTRDVKPGESSEVVIAFDKYAISFWSEMDKCWMAPAGLWTVTLRESAAEADIIASFTFQLARTLHWSGV